MTGIPHGEDPETGKEQTFQPPLPLVLEPRFEGRKAAPNTTKPRPRWSTTIVVTIGGGDKIFLTYYYYYYYTIIIIFIMFSFFSIAINTFFSIAVFNF